MATADDYAQWIVDNQAKKGTPEFDTVAQAYQEAKGSDKASMMPSNRIGAAVQAVSEPLTAMATGLAGTVAGGLAGGVAALTPGLRPGIGKEVVEKVSNAMTYQPRTEGGKAVLGAIQAPFEWLAGKAGQAGQATLDRTGSPLAATAVDTGIQALPMVVGGGISRMAGGPESAASVAARTAEAAKAAPKTALVEKAKDAGYVLAPGEVNPRAWNVLQGFAGKIKTQQGASLKNVETTNSLVKKSLGVADDVPLSADVLQTVRKVAGQDYEAVKKTGVVPTDKIYTTMLDDIASAHASSAKSFPGRQDPITDLVQRLKVKEFDAASAIDEVRLLRQDADKAFRSGDAALGRADKQAASLLEEQIDRHLVATNAPPDLIQKYRDARKMIAKTYTVQAALNETTGNIIPTKLAAQLARGKPLEGEMRTAAEVARGFPKSTQSAERIGGVQAISPVDTAVSGIQAAASGHYGWLAGLMGRPAVRSLILSDLYQKMLVNPEKFGRSRADVLRAIAAEQSKNAGIAGPTLADMQRRE